MNEETGLFDEFDQFTTSQRKVADPTAEINNTLKQPQVKHYAGEAILRQKLDITREISLLREIKDIQDELSIMSMLFEDQRKVLETMERIIHSMHAGKSELKLQSIAHKEETSAPKVPKKNSTISTGRVPEDTKQDARTIKTGALNPGLGLSKEIRDVNEMAGAADAREAADSKDQRTSEIWKSSRDPKNSSLPLLVVQLSMEEVERMAQRATKAYQAVSWLQTLIYGLANFSSSTSLWI